MVGGYHARRPVRAFTHLTHTGENKSAGPVCCDLSRVARILPAWPLPRHVLNNGAASAPSNHILNNAGSSQNNSAEVNNLGSAFSKMSTEDLTSQVCSYARNPEPNSNQYYDRSSESSSNQYYARSPESSSNQYYARNTEAISNDDSNTESNSHDDSNQYYARIPMSSSDSYVAPVSSVDQASSSSLASKRRRHNSTLMHDKQLMKKIKFAARA